MLINVPRQTTLTGFQERIADRGFRGAELIEGAHGWCLRYDSGLQGFDIIKVDGLPGTFFTACKKATAWVAEDPLHRYAFVRTV
jgi:hypothetical protein